VVCIIIVNGILLNLIVAPKLVSISFQGKDIDENNKPRSLRKLAHVFGAVSFISWYTAFILGSFRQIPFSFYEILLAYAVLLVCVIGGALFMERRLEK
jgi:hypothetical protein